MHVHIENMSGVTQMAGLKWRELLMEESLIVGTTVQVNHNRSLTGAEHPAFIQLHMHHAHI